MKRVASVIMLTPTLARTYRELHAAVWPSVLTRITRSNIANYSIFLRDGMLFSYFEYVGQDYDADLAAVAADPETRRWWALTDPCQQPLASTRPGEWWAPAEELFHLD